MENNDLNFLSNENISHEVRSSYAQMLAANQKSSIELEIEKNKQHTEQRKTKWSTPIVAALASLITLTGTYVFDRLTNIDVTNNTITLREAEFQFEIVKSELADKKKTNSQRAAILLFLARAGVLNSLNKEELISMANEQIQNPDKDIIPNLAGNDKTEFRIAATKKWITGSVVKYSYMQEPTEAQKALIENATLVWQKYANIKFEEVDSPEEAMIRISIDASQSDWSYVGRDALRVSPNNPTMNFSFSSNSDVTKVKNEILSNIGHALGMVNEVSNPIDGIEWNEQAVYERYSSEPYFWTKEKIYVNMLKKISTYPCSREFDPNSIMMDYIPEGLTLDGSEINPKLGLSASDIACIQEMYPFDLTGGN